MNKVAFLGLNKYLPEKHCEYIFHKAVKDDNGIGKRSHQYRLAILSPNKIIHNILVEKSPKYYGLVYNKNVSKEILLKMLKTNIDLTYFADRNFCEEVMDIFFEKAKLEKEMYALKVFAQSASILEKYQYKLLKLNNYKITMALLQNKNTCKEIKQEYAEKLGLEYAG